MNVLVNKETPIYIVVGESDEYYGSTTSKNTYNSLVEMYEEKGLSKERISELVTLDIKNSQYFSNNGITNQHGHGGSLFCRDETIMNWLFSTR